MTLVPFCYKFLLKKMLMLKPDSFGKVNDFIYFCTIIPNG